MSKVIKISESLFDIAEPTEQISRAHVRALAQRILGRSGHRDLVLDAESLQSSDSERLADAAVKG